MEINNIKNIALLVEYDGSCFFGFQKQIGTRTIQGELELALSKFSNEKINLISAGRTDTGVHATGQVVNFTTTETRTLSGYIRGVNALLPKDIVVLNATIVDINFNARFDAISRTYHYYLLNTKVRPAILNHKVGWFHEELNLNLMQQACNILLGTHDFSSFRASQCQANSPIKTMAQSNVSKLEYIPNIFCFKFTANSFLYHMIRNIVGSIIYVGCGKLSITEFSNLLVNRNRTLAPPTFMASGLYLTEVKYKPPLNF